MQPSTLLEAGNWDEITIFILQLLVISYLISSEYLSMIGEAKDPTLDF